MFYVILNCLHIRVHLLTYSHTVFHRWLSCRNSCCTNNYDISSGLELDTQLPYSCQSYGRLNEENIKRRTNRKPTTHAKLLNDSYIKGNNYKYRFPYTEDLSISVRIATAYNKYRLKLKTITLLFQEEHI